LVTDATEWFAELDRHEPEPFMAGGRNQPTTPVGPVLRELPARPQRLHRAPQRQPSGRPDAAGAALKDGASVAVSAVVAFELWYGTAKRARKQANRQRLETFFAGPLELVPFDDEDARAADELRAALETAGTPIGAYDLLIAGQALRYDATLVTASTAEFSGSRAVPGGLGLAELSQPTWSGGGLFAGGADRAGR
jgi:tRNA(fMet)-specific endonuclease VapC